MKKLIVIILILASCNLFAQQYTPYNGNINYSIRPMYYGLLPLELLPIKDSTFYIGGATINTPFLYHTDDTITGLISLKDFELITNPPPDQFEVIKAFFCGSKTIRGWTIKFDQLMQMKDEAEGLQVYIVSKTNPTATFYRKEYSDTLSISYGFDEKLNIKIK